MSVVIGCDVSSHQLDFAILDGDSVRFECVDLGKGTLIKRVAEASYRAPYYVPSGIPWLVIEEPYGHSQRGLRALWSVVGALTCSWGEPNRTAWLSPQDWRAELGAKNTKTDGHEAVQIRAALDNCRVADDSLLDGHRLDALGVALAWRSILSKQKAVA